MGTWISWATGLLVLIGTILWGAQTFDGRYAKAAELQEAVVSFKTLYIGSEKRAAQNEAFGFEVQKEKRKLTPLDEQRYKQVLDDLKSLDAQEKTLQKAGGKP